MTATATGHTGGRIARPSLMSSDHVLIGKLYLLAISLFLLVGTGLGVAMLVAQVTLNRTLAGGAVYGRLFSAHGMIMVFLFAAPSLLATFGNSILPAMIGATRMAFPRANRLGLLMFVVGGLTVCVGLSSGAYDAGWAGGLPSSTPELLPYALLLSGLILLCLSLFINCLNIVWTIHRCRAQGTGVFGLSIMAWTFYLASGAMLFASVERFVLLVLMLASHLGQGSYIQDSLFLEHLDWFSASPMAYLTLLPVIGVISEIMQTFTTSRLFAADGLKFSCLAIAVLSFFSWGQHLIVSGQSDLTSLLFSLFSLLLAIPSTFVLGSWVATLYRRSTVLQPPVIFALAAVALFFAAGLTGGIQSIASVNVQTHGSIFVVGHLHLAMLGTVVGGFLAALSYWAPLLFPAVTSGRTTATGAALFVVGSLALCLPLLDLGLAGIVRRTIEPSHSHLLAYGISGLGSLLLLASFICVGFPVIKHSRRGDVKVNPWEAISPEFNPDYEWPGAAQPKVSDTFTEHVV